jgi:hypothetical protein
MKLYLASILGLSKTADVPGKEEKRFYIHIPSLIEGESIEDAQEEACVLANNLFLKRQGFYLKHITLKPITEEEYLLLLRYAHAGLITDKELPEQKVYFLCDEADVDPDDLVIFELDKPSS